MNREHISFSELKIWNDCAYKHKLTYIDEVKRFIGNEYTAFGKAIHDTCEKSVLSGSAINQKTYFTHRFLKEIQDLFEKGVEMDKKLLKDMKLQAEGLVGYIIPELKKYFGNYEVISAEEDLYLPIEGLEHKYKGYIDLVLKTQEGKYHIIDWKTCSWGWDSRRKNDSMTTYQLTYYKNFFAKKHGIDLNDIETYFALLKRTAKNNKVEIFKVPTGKKKIENSLKLLNKAVYNIKNKRYIKNRLSCTSGYGCEFYNTQHCSG